ncbi:MAG TPA: glycosyltransferase [Burkholderiales bacterium]|nr:glycosyltransferase [Burkholderiales bacterium]
MICHITSVHSRNDIRIFVKECVSLANVYNTSLILADNKGFEIKEKINIYDVGKEKNRVLRILYTPKKIYNQLLLLKPSVVHFHDPELIFLGNKLIKLGIKVIYDVHEDVPKQILHKRYIPKIFRLGIAKVVQIIESKYSKRFSGIITATPMITERFKKYNKNTITLYNYPIMAEMKFNNDNSWSVREDALCYIGSISQERGIIELIDSLSFSNMRLELAGAFSNTTLSLKLKSHPNWHLVNYHGVLNREGVIKLLQKVKIGIVTLLPTPSYIESLPIKLFEYMLAGIPIVASNFKLWEEIVLKYNCGLLVDPLKPESISQACNYLITNPKQAKSMGENGKNAVIQLFNWEMENKKLIEFYAKIT